VQKYDPDMPIHVIGNVLYIKQIADKCANTLKEIICSAVSYKMVTNVTNI
jgi:hypothetical protein